jgi:hypothetical protein
MKMRHALMTAGIGLGLAFGAAGVAPAADQVSEEAHAEAGQAHEHGTLSLDQGEKWATDQPLRQGMSGIREAMAEVTDEIHANELPPEGYDQLASAVEEQVNYMIVNCALPPDADAQLHILLEQMFEGIEGMRGADPQGGSVQVAQALDAYGKYFDHEGWEPLVH